MSSKFAIIISDGEPLKDIVKNSFTRSTQPKHPPNCYEKDYLLADLLNVGKTKLMGYLPLRTIKDLCQSNPLDIRQQLIDQGLSTYFFDESECKVGSGALYACDIERLQEFLDLQQHRFILEKYDWPNNAEDFLLKVVHVTAYFETYPELYDLIALAFNDKRPFYQNFDVNPEGPQPYRYE